MSELTTTSHVKRDGFPLTRWTVIMAARRDLQSQAGPAMEAICKAYWYPLYAYARKSGVSPHDAEDLTQEFFSRLLEKGWLDRADPEKGRLRTFLIVALKRFLHGERRRASAQRRGGSVRHVDLDTAWAEKRFSAEGGSNLAPDQSYDRQWAIALHDQTLQRLEGEYSEAGKAGDFEALKDCLMAARGGIDYRLVGARLGSSEGAARVAVHRLRKRFREIYREEISHTVGDAADLEDELRHLAQALARE